MYCVAYVFLRTLLIVNQLLLQISWQLYSVCIWQVCFLLSLFQIGVSEPKINQIGLELVFLPFLVFVSVRALIIVVLCLRIVAEDAVLPLS